MSKFRQEEPNAFIHLFCCRNATLDFYSRVMAQLATAIPHLERGEVYSPEELLGQGFWESLSPGEQATAKNCLVKIVMEKVFPLGFCATSDHYYFGPAIGGCCDIDAAIRAYITSAN